ncbi:EamA family transporter [Flavobacterium sp. CAU 1735]|uniref:EamA family transporter n=1 Tax=Flavobacterium sp. CAU 1735 TaxID=3140361 RepID=UPI00326013C9
MHFLIFSILCSVSVGILFKIAKRYTVSFQQMINYNYIVAIILCYVAYQPDTTTITSNAPWSLYGILALLLPTVFLVLAASVRHIGIVKTDIAQRFSLIISILAAFLVFNETISPVKWIGLAIGFTAIFLVLYRNETTSGEKNNWWYPIIVLLGFGIIDVCFKLIAAYTEIPYTTSLFVVFCGALVVSTAITLYTLLVKKEKVNGKSVLFGLALGVLNFGNILFYLKAHKALHDNPSTVFASMNFGVILLGTLAGTLVFKEKISRLNAIGIFMAFLAIIVITASQLYTL